MNSEIERARATIEAVPEMEKPKRLWFEIYYTNIRTWIVNCWLSHRKTKPCNDCEFAFVCDKILDQEDK